MLPLLVSLALQAAAAQGAAPPPAPPPPAPPAPPAPPSPGQIAEAAPAADWRAIPADQLLVMTLGDGRRVTIQLAPQFARAHFDAVRKLAAAGWWDRGTAITRVQDNYVAQWGALDAKAPLPAGMADDIAADYDVPATRLIGARRRDAYARETGFLATGWPAASDGRRMWLPHCYGYVGVGRDLKPSTGSGAELYAVIGHAPRHLDRNIAVIGRVVAGIETLSALPRGTGALGFYEQAAQRVPIRSIRLGSHLPAADQPRFEYLAPGTASFAKYQQARENREPPFFERPAGGADVCNVPVPVRAAKG